MNEEEEVKKILKEEAHDDLFDMEDEFIPPRPEESLAKAIELQNQPEIIETGILTEIKGDEELKAISIEEALAEVFKIEFSKSIFRNIKRHRASLDRKSRKENIDMMQAFQKEKHRGMMDKLLRKGMY